ncbi:hypothetical protein GYMLUDRAFT_52379 [Collybiopsis luxurians FD-317 M1]|nr:hypothetical protein GYMLUDRAFT_52379 [Collybiopsis luxurians FD-317 M1]
MREIKRRRVQPPVLDGQMRGWGTPQDILYEDFDEEDDGEEDVIEDEQPLTSDSAVLAVNSPYRSANGFLHELHTLQRHRLLFTSSTSNPQLSFSPLPAHDSSSHQSHALSHQPDKGLVRTGANTRRECFEDSLSALNARKQQEYDLVKGNYEEMNR